MADLPTFHLDPTSDPARLIVAGNWVVRSVNAVDDGLRRLSVKDIRGSQLVCDLADLGQLDTAGAWLLIRTRQMVEDRGIRMAFHRVSEKHERLLAAVSKDQPPPARHPEPVPLYDQIAGRIGDAVLAAAEELRGLAGLFGQILEALWGTLKMPPRLRITALVSHMERAGFDALPIVALMTFLIGAVLAQQGAVQLQRFGAEVYTVNMVAITFLREIGILLTAIIVAGRSGSAFAAEIGSMKMREEIDAMRALGLSPIETLVLPRTLALIFTLPLLAFLGDIMGIVGGGVAVWVLLDMPPAVYAMRLQEASDFWTFGVGMVKAPFMALVIALIGCHAGLQVAGSAESVGRQTTLAVVKSIFMVIILDALFAMFFTAMDI